MIPKAWNKWYSRQSDRNLTDKSRTHDLVTNLRYASDSTSFEVFNKNLNLLIPDYSALGLISYLDTHLDMINYEFDNEGNLIKINVDPNKIFTFKHDSKVRQCNMSLGITKLLESYFSSHGYEFQVTMVNKDYCKKVEGTAVHTEANAADAADTNADADAAPAPPSDTALHAGGSKSRRKPVRKTRRGRGRGRSRKPKSKTHRRRRHSRVRKHKKNTYTRRR
jgi:hypothetical protein